MPTADRLSTAQDVRPTPPAIEAFVAAITTTTLTPSPSHIVVVQEVAPTATEAVALATQAGSTVALSSIIVTPLLIAGVAATGAPTMLSSSSTTPVASHLRFA